ncbi:MAG: sigma-54 dependent transcriptional regulator [Kofleriaceae bacterium]
MSVRVLVVDDDELLGNAIASGLSRRGFDAACTVTVEATLTHLAHHQVELVLLDVHLPDADGIRLCAELIQRWPALDVVVMSGSVSIDRAVAAVRAGALDFICKPFTVDALARRITDTTHGRTAPSRGPAAGPHHGLRGASTAMAAVREVVSRIAPSSASVLITGESGTGKELVARALHREGRRAAGPFVAINCAALPESLLESELFGHVRGAFTDARTDHPGLFAQAHGGTIFLDEIGELPRPLQPKLLRTLEERTLRPLGASAEVAVDVRVVAATHRDLLADIDQARFRADLYYRLNVLRVALPPLRDRLADVPELARHFTAQAARQEGKRVRDVTPAALARLAQHAWPGNVRELRNCLEHAVALTQGEVIDVGDLPLAPLGPDAPPPASTWPTLADHEEAYVEAVLAHVGGNHSAAARILGIDRRTLLRRVARRRYAANSK